MYKRAENVIENVIVGIFNTSIAEGAYPEMLKVSRVVPVYKSKSSKDMCNYRPIAVLYSTYPIKDILKNS